MYFINPFKGLRPNGDKASSVSIPSTDHLSDEIIANHKKDNPWSYLNIFNPDLKTSKSQNEIDIKAKEKFQKMKNNSILMKDNVNSFYIYKISTKNHAQIGIIGTAKLSAYDNLHIRGHEEIYFERSQKRFEQIDNLNAQIGPIYVIYPDNSKLTALIEKQTSSKPEYSFAALDECRHELWVINNENTVLSISELFNTINRIYIADGHHRIEALSKLSEFRKHQNPNHTGQEPYNYFMVAIFPKSQARILDYNRLVKDLYGYSNDEFLKQVKKKFILEKHDSSYKPKESKSFGMYLDKTWYSIKLKKKPEENLFHIINLDINLLHYYLLEPILGIGDPRYDNRVDFLAGFHGLKAIEKKVDSGEVKIGFSLFATQMEDVISFADKKLTMPPKSTWFDPKPLDGLVAYDFE
jgi:uncharacterized protein (DUF1015 family)|tara:strand:+ start:2115 stop:3344 length:1230 start_codon:yes stop_codon:yes gene_type:complete